MAIKEGVTEIPDSEDEPLSSSPQRVPDGFESLFPQPSQQASEEKECFEEDHVDDELASKPDENLVVDRGNASKNNDMANLQPDDRVPQHLVQVQVEASQQGASENMETSHETNHSDQQVDFCSTGLPSIQSAQTNCEQDVGSEAGKLSHSNSPQSETIARAGNEHTTSVEAGQPIERMLGKSVSDEASETTKLKPSEVLKPDTRVSEVYSQALNNDRLSPTISDEHAKPEAKARETVDSGSSAEPNMAQAGLVAQREESAESSPMDESNTTTSDRERRVEQRSEDGNDSLDTIANVVQRQQHNEEEDLLGSTSKNASTPTDAMDLTQGTPSKQCPLIHPISMGDGTETWFAEHTHPQEQPEGVSSIPSGEEELQSDEKPAEQPRVEVETSASLANPTMSQDQPPPAMSDRSMAALTRSTPRETVHSGGDVEMSDSEKAPEAESSAATTRTWTGPEMQDAEQPTLMDMEDSSPVVEHTTVPQISTKEVSVQDTAAAANADVPKGTEDSKMQTGTPEPEDKVQQQTPSQLSSPMKAPPTQIRSSPVKSSQEATVSELRAKRAALLASLAALPNVQALVEDDKDHDDPTQDPDAEPTDADIMKAANKIVKAHIKLLHEYNEMKDVGQGLMGLIADSRGVRIVEVQDEFGIESKD